MPQVIIEEIDPTVVEKLKQQAVLRGRSMNDRVYKVLITNILS